jgi:MFS family permease
VLAGMLVFCVTEAAFAVSQIALISLVLIATVGAAEDLFATLGTTMLQTLAPDHLRGRITGVYIFVFNGSVPVGYLMVGWLSDRFGPSRALLALALASLTVVIAGWITRDMAEPRLSATPTQQEAP